MEVAHGVHRIETPLGERFVCMFLLVGSENSLLIDTGLNDTPLKVLAPYLERVGVRPERLGYVVTTHADFDHMGGNATMRELAPRARFICHALDRTWIEDIDKLIAENYGQFNADHGLTDDEDVNRWIRAQACGTPIDVEVQGGERIRLDEGWWIELWHTPGHTRGHLSVYDPRSRTMIIADSALYNALYTSAGVPAFPPTYRFVESYIATIQRLRQTPIETLLTSHYPVKRGAEVAEFLAESRAFVDRVESALRDTLQRAAEPVGMQALIAELSPKLGSWPGAASSFLIYPLAGHLERLVSYGMVEVAYRDGVLVYRWKGEKQ
jgi:glyoxylase-like metal-dependent hydrolase (beta-lactamase superfamily II)